MKQKTSKKKKGFPVYITGEPMSITIYKERCRGDVRYALTYYEPSGARQRRTYATFDEADEASDKLMECVSQGGWDITTLRGSERLAYERAMNELRPHNVPLDLAVMKLVEALRILGGDQIVEAARWYKSQQAAVALPRKMVPEVVAELIANRKANEKSFLYLKDLTLRLRRFAEAHKMPISAVTTRDVERFLLKLDVTGRTRLNFLRTIGSLFNFAKAQGYLPQSHPGTCQVTRPSVTPTEVEVFTPDEMRSILQKAEPEEIPALAIGAFAGVRSEELKRLDWSDIRLDEGFIEIKARNAKTRVRRMIPISDNLRLWLTPHLQPAGKVYPFLRLHKLFEKLPRKTGFPWKRNGLRHSFVSYRVAATNDVAKTSYEAGNTAAVIMRHYLRVVTARQAEEWFAIKPKVEGVIPIPAAA